jgi:hypothetical protein
MGCIPGIALLTVFLALGILGIAGAYRRWSWLIDPDDRHWWNKYYSQAMLKRLFGSRVLLVYTYVVASLFIAVGLYGFLVNRSSLLECLR